MSQLRHPPVFTGWLVIALVAALLIGIYIDYH